MIHVTGSEGGKKQARGIWSISSPEIKAALQAGKGGNDDSVQTKVEGDHD